MPQPQDTLPPVKRKNTRIFVLARRDPEFTRRIFRSLMRAVQETGRGYMYIGTYWDYAAQAWRHFLRSAPAPPSITVDYRTIVPTQGWAPQHLQEGAGYPTVEGLGTTMPRQHDCLTPAMLEVWQRTLPRERKA